MNIYKKTYRYILSGIVLLDIVLLVLTERIFTFINHGVFYIYEPTVLEPLFYASPFLFLSVLLLFKPQTFKHWLLYIAWWYLPLSIYIVSQTSIYAGFLIF